MSTGPAPRTTIRRLVAESDDQRLTHLLVSETEVTTHPFDGAFSDVEERVTEVHIEPINQGEVIKECPHVDPVLGREEARGDTVAQANGECCGSASALSEKIEPANGGLDASLRAELDQLMGNS